MEPELEPELSECRWQIEAIRRDATRLLDGMSEDELTWRENGATWSIADCLNHLAVTGNQSLPRICEAISDGRSRGLLGRGPFRHGFLGNCLIRLMDAPPAVKFKVPAPYRPAPDLSVSEIVAGFYLLQHDLIEALKGADGIDLSRARVTNPVTRWLTMSLGQEFAFTAAHERRHLWQASQIKRKLHA